MYLFILILTRGYIYLFQRERNIDVREKHPSAAFHTRPKQEQNWQHWHVP